MKKLLLLGLFLVAPCYANGVPSWTTGSSNRTENTTQTITRSVITEKYGSTINTWEASNISTALSSSVLVVCLQIALSRSTTNLFTAVVVKNFSSIGFKSLSIIISVSYTHLTLPTMIGV